ncbi:hypothetical protein [Streptomyces europaeiscabiei]|uniref:hypothetical protein n=1 Tax=Streptomyces europaeiscabiei TaxID=146819 RepID=UPI0029B2D15D|nr:hypothetical protein [Streptomyces europaeiscabiei]MDX3581943.1 hypothetical protein [Streptomyces europaeiscabiei]
MAWIFVKREYPFWSDDDALGGFLLRLMVLAAVVAIFLAVVAAHSPPKDSYIYRHLRTTAFCERCNGMGRINTWRHKGTDVGGSTCPECFGKLKLTRHW